MVNIKREDEFYYIKTHSKEYKVCIEPDDLEKQSDFDNTEVLLNFIEDIRPAEYEIIEVNKISLIEEIFEVYLTRGFNPFRNWFKEEYKIYSKEQIVIFKNGLLF